MSISLTPTRADSAAARIPARDGLLVVAIILIGLAAAWLAMPILWFATPVMAVYVFTSARKATREQEPVLDEGELPTQLQLVLDAAIDRLPLGEPRQLLAEVVRQARPLFAVRESAFDAAMEKETRENVIDLVNAACETALDLWRLDGAAPKARAGSPDVDALTLRYQSARVELVARLRSAATSLSELHAADIEHGTPASDRVATLAAALREDARARSAAKTELES
jgi:hypothetical protein